MTYTKKQFAQELKQQLERGYDVMGLSQWAYLLIIDRYREIDLELDKIIQKIAVMGEGSEFEFSEAELLTLVNQLNISE
ncbi:MAG: hypothetical protein AAGF26_03165 [Cyanobacteria bacterium P01_G01_bin.49]